MQQREDREDEMKSMEAFWKEWPKDRLESLAKGFGSPSVLRDLADALAALAPPIVPKVTK